MKSEAAIKIDHVAIQTANIDQAIWFYKIVLGIELIERRKFKKREMAWLRCGGTRIELFSARDGEELQPWTDYIPGPVHLAFVVQNLDEFLKNAIGHGAKFHPSHPEPFIPPVEGALKIAYLLGPDGEEVEIRT